MRRGCAATLDGLIAAILAPVCIACGTVLQQPLLGPCCASCWASIPAPATPQCRACGVAVASWRTLADDERCAVCRRRPSAVDRGAIAADYSGALRSAVHALKYDRRTSLAGPLAALLRSRAADVLADAHVVVPVPLHPWRRLHRGFNQATLLAAGLGPPMREILRRSRPTAAQVGLLAAARRRNVRGAFAPAWSASWARRCVEDRIVVLVDDVRTTGATLHECAAVLKTMGAAEVRSAVLAQAPVRDQAEV